ncbi:MAG: aminotransferase class I/II-fold pyridoxal phosphate-dependent enzyme, partial [Pseudomonadota bacterium]
MCQDECQDESQSHGARSGERDQADRAARLVFSPVAEALPDTVPFVGPETLERARGRPFEARLGANENGFGPSPAVREALARAASEAWMYGDPEGGALRAALAERLDAPLEAIVLSEGIDGLLGLACRLALPPGAVAVSSLGGYPTFAYHVIGHGARLAAVPYREDRCDLQGLAAAARDEGARVVYLANPDNPMGAQWSAEAVDRFIDATPEHCLILLDEAYLETAEGAAPPIAADLTRPNLVRLRTFSKAHGLAGMRVGYAIGAPETVAAFHKVRNHFGVGRLAQIAALAALQDEAGLGALVRAIAESRLRIAEIAEASGLTTLPSSANFVAVDCG